MLEVLNAEDEALAAQIAEREQQELDERLDDDAE